MTGEESTSVPERVRELLEGDWCASLRAEEALLKEPVRAAEALLARGELWDDPPAAVLRFLVRAGPSARDLVASAVEQRRIPPSIGALRALGEHLNAGSVGAYFSLLEHADPELREQAAAYLTRASRDPRVRSAILPILAEWNSPTAREALRTALSDPSPAVRAAAMAACLRTGAADLIADAVRSLGALDAKQRGDAAAAILGRLEAIPPQISEVIRSMSPQERDLAAETLTDYLHLGGGLELVLELTTEVRAATLLTRKLTDPRLRGRAVVGLRRLAHYPLEPLFDLCKYPLPDVRAAAVELLAHAGERALRPLVQWGLLAADDRLRFEAKAALAQMGDPAAAELVRRFDGFPHLLRHEVIALLGRIGSPVAIGTLCVCLRERDLAAQAAGALAALSRRTNTARGSRFKPVPGGGEASARLRGTGVRCSS